MHINIRNSDFDSNGSISGPGVVHILFDMERELFNIKLESNVFKHNSSHTNRAVIEIVNDNEQISDEQLNGEY